MRFSTTLLILCCTISLPACLAAAGSDSLDPALDGRFGHDFDLGPSIDLGTETGAGLDYDFDRNTDLGVGSVFDPRLEPECGCVFPSSDPDVSVAAICGEGVCFEETTYFCTYEGTALAIGDCLGSSDGEFDLTDYDFPNDDALASSCQGNAGECDGDTSLTCEAKVGCTFFPNGECVGNPIPCSNRIEAACTEFGGECFHVNPFEA